MVSFSKGTEGRGREKSVSLSSWLRRDVRSAAREAMGRVESQKGSPAEGDPAEQVGFMGGV